jgi:hypothetical protein
MGSGVGHTFEEVPGVCRVEVVDVQQHQDIRHPGLAHQQVLAVGVQLIGVETRGLRL